jgi:hypothetical protein
MAWTPSITVGFATEVDRVHGVPDLLVDRQPSTDRGVRGDMKLFRIPAPGLPLYAEVRSPGQPCIQRFDVEPDHA